MGKINVRRVLKKIKLRTYIAVGIILLLVPVVVFSLFKPGKTEATWMDDAWGYRAPWSFTHNAALTDRRVSFTIANTDTLVTAGKMQSDCDDVRFTDINGNLLLIQLVSGCNSASTVYDVVVPAVVSGVNAGYIYYGNPAALTASQDVSSYTSLSPSGGAAAFSTEEKGTGPVAYWNFDEGYGTTTSDASSNRKTATFGASTAAPIWASEDQCVSGKCIDFDGTNDYLDIGNSTPYQTASKTISFWARPDIDASGTTPLVSSGGANWYVGFAGNGDKQMIASYAITAGTQQVTYSNVNKVIKNTWAFYSYVFTVNGANVDVSFYINGVLDVTNSYATGYNATYSNSWIMGAFTSGTLFYNGKMDEVKIYNYARTAPQIKADLTSRGGLHGTNSTLGGTTQSTLNNGLVGYWKMDDNVSGDNASLVDTSGNGNTATTKYGANVTGMDCTTGGRYGAGCQFDGVDDYTTIANPAIDDFGTGSMTVQTWVKTTTTDFASLIDNKTAGTNNAGFNLQITATNGMPYFRVANGSTQSAITSSVAINNGSWHQLVGVLSRGATVDTMYVYVDGSLTGTANTSSAGWNITSAQALVFGAYGSSAANANLNGNLDEVRIYNRALSPTEIRQLYNWAPGPLGSWSFEEKSGTTANDTSGNGHTATLNANFNNNSDSGWTTGKFGNAVHYDGTNDVTQVLSGSAFSLVGSGDITVEAWVRLDTIHATTNSRILTYQQDASNGYHLALLSGSNGTCASRFIFEVRKAGTYYSGGCSTSNAAAVVNMWYHVVGIFNGTTDTSTLYINGIPQVTGSTASLGLGVATRLSWASQSTAGTNLLDGIIDETKIYNYARTAGQIVEDMNGSHPLGGSPVGSYVSYWRMDEANGTTAHDYNDTNGNSLTLSTSSWDLSGKTNSTWKGVGTNWLSRADDDDFDLASTDNGSISLWFKSSSATNPASTEYLFAKGRGTPPGYALYINTSGFLCFSVDDDVTWTPDDTACTTIDIYDATWHHVVVEKTGTTELRLYLDGLSRAADTSIAATGTLASSGLLYVGDDDGDATNAFVGDIDEVKFYRSALTRDQVLFDYNAGATINFGSTASVESAQLTDGTGVAPVGYWPLDEKTGTTTSDISGNGNTGTLSGNVAWTQGKIGSGLNYTSPTSSGGVVTVPFASSINDLSTITAEAWIYPRTTGGSTSGRILAKGNEANNGWFWRLHGSNGMRFQAYYGTQNLIVESANNTVTLNQWNHVVVTWDGTTSVSSVVFYVNGKVVGYGTTQVGIGTDSSDAAENARIGDNPAQALGFDGVIDDVKLFNYVRTQSQIAYDYNRGQPVGYWKLDECSGSTVNDSSGNGNTGTIKIEATGSQTSIGTCNTASSAWGNGATGKFNAGLNFDGTDDYACVDSASDGSCDTAAGSAPYGTNFSAGAWIKRSSSGTEDGIVGKSDFNFNASGFRIKLTSSNVVSVRVGNAGTTQVTTTQTITDTNWHHIFFTYDGSNIYVYIDGRLSTTGAATGTVGQDTLNQFTIGVLEYNDALTDYFAGQIDEVRVYNYTLSAAQIKKLYNGGASVNFGPSTGQP